MSTAHTVTLPDGTIAKRTSANRSYSHVVLRGPQSRADVIDREQRTLERVEREHARYRVVIDYVTAGGELVVQQRESTLFGPIVHAPGLPGNDPYRGIGWCGKNGKFYGMEGDTLAEQVIAWYSKLINDEYPTELRARIDELNAGPEWVGGWDAVTWASRPDLAEKAAVKYRGNGREIQILATERTTK